jgi:hypothetical protein
MVRIILFLLADWAERSSLLFYLLFAESSNASVAISLREMIPARGASGLH